MALKQLKTSCVCFVFSLSSALWTSVAFWTQWPAALQLVCKFVSAAVRCDPGFGWIPPGAVKICWVVPCNIWKISEETTKRMKGGGVLSACRSAEPCASQQNVILTWSNAPLTDDWLSSNVAKNSAPSPHNFMTSLISKRWFLSLRQVLVTYNPTKQLTNYFLDIPFLFV